MGSYWKILNRKEAIHVHSNNQWGTQISGKDLTGNKNSVGVVAIAQVRDDGSQNQGNGSRYKEKLVKFRE